MKDFQELYEKYSQVMFQFILRIVNYREELAEELTQETFYQVFISLHRYRGDCELKTWICQIAKNTCYKYYRKNPIHISMDAKEFDSNTVLDTFTQPEKHVVNRELRHYITQCIYSLKGKYKDVLIYRIFFEMSFCKIADIMQISENSAKVTYFRGKEQLKKKVEGYLNG